MKLNQHGLATDEPDLDPAWLIEWSMATNRGGPNAQYIYNFRPDTETEECTSACGDAARWPTPATAHRYLGPTRVETYDDEGTLIETTYVEIGEAA